MQISETDERLIQRCVDEELSREEVSKLLRRLDELHDGWKTLACGLLEDRRLRAWGKLHSDSAMNSVQQFALNEIPQPHASGSHVSAGGSVTVSGPHVSGGTSSQAFLRNHAGYWWSHPVTSLALCAAIAFVGGLLMPDGIWSSARNVEMHAKTNGSPNSQRVTGSPAAQNHYRVELQREGQPYEIPVVTDLTELDSNHPLFRDSQRSGDRIQWVLLPVEPGKSMLIPVSHNVGVDLQ